MYRPSVSFLPQGTAVKCLLQQELHSKCFDFLKSSALFFFSLVHVCNCMVGIFDVVSFFD